MEFWYTFPAVKGIQANKDYYITMVPLKYLVKILPEPTEYVPPEYRAQRKLNETRIPEMKDYILENRDNYVFSSLTASIDGEYMFQQEGINGSLGMLHISMDAKILINDGQHRRAAIAQALLEDDSLMDETISVVFFEDMGLEKSQQMFTDLNMNAQKSSNSINTCYETRNPLAVVTKQLVAEIPFLSRYTDLEKDNLGKNSSKLFTLYTIYRVNRNILRDDEIKEGDKAFLTKFWSLLVDNIPEWLELEKHSITKKDLRECYVTTLGVTLLSLSRIGIWFYDNRDVRMEEYMSKLQKINWSRSNKMWQRRMIRDDGKVMNNENSIYLIGNVIKKSLGIPLTKEEQKRERIFEENN